MEKPCLSLDAQNRLLCLGQSNLKEHPHPGVWFLAQQGAAPWVYHRCVYFLRYAETSRGSVGIPFL